MTIDRIEDIVKLVEKELVVEKISSSKEVIDSRSESVAITRCRSFSA